jgi:hypothetical protein
MRVEHHHHHHRRRTTMPGALTQHTFKIRTTDGAEETVEAAYYDFDDDAPFCTFKDTRHGSVASFTHHQLVSVVRLADDAPKPAG